MKKTEVEILFLRKDNWLERADASAIVRYDYPGTGCSLLDPSAEQLADAIKWARDNGGSIIVYAD